MQVDGISLNQQEVQETPSAELTGKPSRNARLKTNSGFSLTELMIVIGLLTFLAMGAASSLDIHSWIAGYRLRSSARQVFMDMQKARMMAIKDNQQCAIMFEPSNSSYYFQYWDSVSEKWKPESPPSENLFKLEQGIHFGAGSASFDATDEQKPFDSANYITFTGDRVTFNSLGLPTKSGYCYICSANGDAYAIGTNTCGVIKLKRWHDNDWES